jgi:hypothetical protein
MKNLLIATTALVATAGMASAEITFSGKGEAGMYRTAKTAAVAAVAGKKASVTGGASTTDATAKVSYVSGVLTAAAHTAATDVYAATGPSAADIAAAKLLITIQDRIVETQTAAALVDMSDGDADTATGTSTSLAAAIVHYNAATVHRDLATAASAEIARLNLQIATMTGTAAVDAVAASDMIAYSGYDMNVAVSAESDNGIVFGMGFDMGAGLIADQNDDRAMDAQGATIATSALTATMNGIKLSIGSDKLDDTYDDSQNGDIGLSGNVGGVAFNLVHDLTDEVVAVAGSTVYTTATNAASATDFTAGSDTLVVTEAVAATIETTSLSLGGAVGDIAWSLAATTGDDRGDSAAKGSVTYSGVENLSLTLAHDNVGKLEGITKVTAKYTMGSLTATLSMADDKNKNSNSNVGGKASNNLSLAYAANGLAATFATDESSQWWVNTQYDLGGGAQAFATIDHTEFAVVGLNFAF